MFNILNVMAIFKASAHSFERFTSRLLKIIFLSLFALITSDECHAWFHLNAASQAARNTEQVNITKKILFTVGFEPPTPPQDYKFTFHTTWPPLAWYQIELNVLEICYR